VLGLHLDHLLEQVVALVDEVVTEQHRERSSPTCAAATSTA
jgi:hypothetical protein